MHTSVPTLAVLGVRDPLIPSADRVREVAGLAAGQLAVAVIEKAAHAVNFSHPAGWRARSRPGWTIRASRACCSLNGVRLFPAPGRPG